ncbi:MAG TPA: hypothetical protein DEB39_10060 [Planctomycetaceae bacterium]|nr:hypothetical protein [Planctomycetaceae bacterium]
MTLITSIISSLFTLLFFGGNSTVEQKKINVQVNDNLEFMSSLLLTSDYNKITKPHIGYGLMTEESNPYTDAINGFFLPYRTSAIYDRIEAMIPNGFTFSRPVELMLALGDSKDFSLQYPLSELCVQYCGGMEQIDSLLRQLHDFSKETDYFEFFETVKAYYDPYLQKADSCLQSLPFVPLVEDFYGKAQHSYNFVLSGLMVGDFGLSFPADDTAPLDLFSVHSLGDIDNVLSAGLIFHELSHPFINPLTQKYWHIAENYSDVYERLKVYKLPGFESGYGDWQECVNEHLVRAATIHFLSKSGQEEEANRNLENDLNRGYKYIPAILELFVQYDHNREKYRTLEEFYPMLLNVFGTEI